MRNRIGQGFDVHKLEAGAPLIIGGVSIPSNKGSLGHSDGDVLFHAIADACLGALAQGDIGQYFPSSDDKWKNANSQHFLEHSLSILNSKGYSIGNIDSTIILQKPQINNYIIEMRKNIAQIFSISMDDVSVKATTTDKLGFIGSEEGIAAMTVVIISESNEN